jgi:hypothetical protein
MTLAAGHGIIAIAAAANMIAGVVPALLSIEICPLTFFLLQLKRVLALMFLSRSFIWMSPQTKKTRTRRGRAQRIY